MNVFELCSLYVKCFEILKEKAEKERRDYQTASNVLKSSTKPMDVKVYQLTAAHASMKAWFNLTKICEHNETAPWKEHSELALSMAQHHDRYEVASVQYGTAFLNLLVAWLGFSRSPWSFCTAPEARLIWKSAQKCLTQAESDLGPD